MTDRHPIYAAADAVVARMAEGAGPRFEVNDDGSLRRIDDPLVTSVEQIEAAMRVWFHGTAVSPYTMRGHNRDAAACAHCHEAADVAVQALAAVVGVVAVQAEEEQK